MPKPNLFNAHVVLRERLHAKRRIPFTPIQAFGLPLILDVRIPVAFPSAPLTSETEK